MASTEYTVLTDGNDEKAHRPVFLVSPRPRPAQLWENHVESNSIVESIPLGITKSQFIESDATSRQEHVPSNFDIGISHFRRSEPIQSEPQRCTRHGIYECDKCQALQHRIDAVRTHSRRVAPQSLVRQESLKTIDSDAFRTDPFDSFPIKNGIHVKRAINHLINYVGPMLFSNMPVLANPITRIAVPFAMQHADLFEAMVSFSLANYNGLAMPDALPTKAFLFHRGRAIKMLQEKMSDPTKCADDAAILSNIYLMSGANSFQEHEAIGIYYLGLKRMVAVRGGLDNLGLNGYVKNCILYIESMALGNNEDVPPTTEEPVAPVKTLKYPRHPFSPELCAAIAKLPIGFGDLAMNAMLSEDLVNIAVKILSWAKTPGKDGRSMLMEEGPSETIQDLRNITELATTADGPRAEKIACIALEMLSVQLFTQIKLNTITTNRWTQIQRYVLEPVETLLERELTAWTLMLAAQAASDVRDSSKMTKSSIMIMNHLMDNEIFALSWETLEPVLRKFFYNDKLAGEWRQCWQDHKNRRTGTPRMTSERSQSGTPPSLHSHTATPASTARRSEPSNRPKSSSRSPEVT